MLESTRIANILTILTILACMMAVVADDSVVVVTSNKFNKPILDTSSLKEHNKLNEVPNYIVDASQYGTSYVTVAKQVLQTAGINKDHVNSFVVQANQLKRTIEQSVNKLISITPEQMSQVLRNNPESVIYFADSISHKPRILQDVTQTPTTNISSLFVNMTPSVLSGLFVAIFILVVLLIAISCLYDIKTNDKYALNNLFVGKES